MKPVLTIVGPEASDIHAILNTPGSENFTISKVSDSTGERLEIVDAAGERHEVPTDDITVYVHDRKYHGFEYDEATLEENVDINIMKFIEKNLEGDTELVLGIE